METVWQSLNFHEEFIQAAGAAGADLLHKGGKLISGNTCFRL